MKSLRKSCYVIESLEFGNETKISEGKMTLKKLELDSSSLEIKKPGEDFFLGKVIDILPLSAKRGDDIGEGITAVVDNGVLLLSADEGEKNTLLSEQLEYDHSGTFTENDFVLHLSCKTDIDTGRELADNVLDEVRKALRKISEAELIKYSKDQGMTYRRHEGKPKILVVKELNAKTVENNHVLGKYQPTSLKKVKNLLKEKKKVRDYSPLEILDGVIINQTSLINGKIESSRHHFRDPLILEFINTDRVDFLEVWIVPVGDDGISKIREDFREEIEKIIEKKDLDGVVYHAEELQTSEMNTMAEIVKSFDLSFVGITMAENEFVSAPNLDVLVNTNKNNNKIGGDNLDFKDTRMTLEMILALIEGKEILPADNRDSNEIRQENFSNLISGEGILRSEIKTTK